MIKNILYFIPAAALAAGIISCKSDDSSARELMPLTQYVNPLIGSGDHGHVFVGANVPFGFVQLGPSEHVRGWDWCSGYHYSDSVLVGFSHTHLSGTGIGELGDITLLPSNVRGTRESTFSHDGETVRPGYYKVALDGVDVELTATERTGMHRYTFAPADSAFVRLDLKYGIGWDTRYASSFDVESDSVISGTRFSSGWAKDQKMFYTLRFSRPFDNISLEGDTVAVMAFAPSADPLLAKVGISAVSIDNARLNLDTENPGWDFDATASGADTKWNEALNTIQVTSPDETDKQIFYTALYHSMFSPSLFSDVNGEYRGADGEVYKSDSGNVYTIFSLWDTYRAAHPLFTLAVPEMQPDFARTFIDIYKQQGVLPVWHLAGNETWCMQGNPGAVVLADLVMKGFDIDNEAAYEALKNSVMADNRSLDLLKEYGYVPYDLDPANETVAKGLEYALADAGVAMVAEKLGKTDDAAYFADRAASYKKYFDPATGFMRGLSSKGEFSTPFDPFHSEPGKGDYCEGNAWQYTWLVPHDVHGLIDLFGGEEQFTAKLDSLFVVEGDFGENVAPDLTGLIGQYVHGNEPSHHIIYLYNYVGQPWKAADRLRETMHKFYQNAPAGLHGNEDVGQMSAWYVMSAMGLYQVEPEGGKFIIGSPIMDEATINPREGKSFTIRAINNSADNRYIQSATLNGQPYTRSYIMYPQIAEGGVLELVMGPEPSAFGSDPADRP